MLIIFPLVFALIIAAVIAGFTATVIFTSKTFGLIAVYPGFAITGVLSLIFWKYLQKLIADAAAHASTGAPEAFFSKAFVYCGAIPTIVAIVSSLILIGYGIKYHFF